MSGHRSTAVGPPRLLKPAHSIVGERQVVLHLRPFRGQFGGPAQRLQSRLQVAVLTVDRAQHGQSLGVIRIVQPLAQRAGFGARAGVQLLRAFGAEFALIGVAPPQFRRFREGLPGFLLAALLPIHHPQLIPRQGIPRVPLRGLLQPFLGRRQIALLEARQAQIISRIRERRLGDGLG
jgi:hypothetical protein